MEQIDPSAIERIKKFWELNAIQLRNEFLVHAMVYFRDNKSPVLRQKWIGNKWREQQFPLDWTEPTLAGLDECIFDEQSWKGGAATSPRHKSKWYVPFY